MKRTWIFLLAISSIQAWAQSVEVDRERERERNIELIDRLNQVRLNGVQVTLAGGGVVKGHPFSATEENRSSQVLGNGARIENKTSTKLFRDFDGRTRTENADGTIVIVDPVGGFRATLNSKTKTGTRNAARGTAFGAVVSANLRTARISDTGTELRENLGVQSVNGVSARGERVTVTIPKGDIGNDRELKVITERWTSEDLQMLIKSVNTDPRYGDTAYELTGISLSAPAPSLFQIPSDYTITQPFGRGKGSGAIAPPAPDAPGGRGRGKQQ